MGGSAEANGGGAGSLRVPMPPARPFLDTFRGNLKETFFPDEPFRGVVRERGAGRRAVAALRYFFPVLDWAPAYRLGTFKSDLIAGITIASLAIPQGISYAKLASLPLILGLYSSFVPPLVYALMGSSKDLAVGTVAVASLLIGSMLSREVSPTEKPALYLHLALTATFFAGVFQASLGLLRLGFIVDFLSHATIVGFMAGAATVVCLQQLKGMLGLDHFTTSTDVVSVMDSVFTQTHEAHHTTSSSPLPAPMAIDGPTMHVWPCARHGGGEGTGSLWSWLSLVPAPAPQQVAMGERPARLRLPLLPPPHPLHQQETAQAVLDLRGGAVDISHPRECPGVPHSR